MNPGVGNFPFPQVGKFGFPLTASLSYAPAFGLIAAFMALVALVFLVAVKDPTAAVAAADRPA